MVRGMITSIRAEAENVDAKIDRIIRVTMESAI